MALAAILVGAIIIIAALRNSQGALGAALEQDVPPFFVWAAAIFAVGVIGWIPKARPISRALMALVIVVLILKNYKAIIAGFQNAWKTAPAQASGAGVGGVLGGIGGSSVAGNSGLTQLFSDTGGGISATNSSTLGGFAEDADAAGIGGIGAGTDDAYFDDAALALGS